MKRRPFGNRNQERDAAAIRVLTGLAPTPPASPTDHGTLTGLGDDDHSQYVHNTSARTITAQHSFSPGSAQPPFALGANAQGQTVTGFKADQLNKSISPGTGMSGGGILTADRTLAVDLTYAFTWSGLHTFNAGARIAAGQSLQFSTDVAISRKAADIAQLGSGDAIESPTFTSGLQGWRIDAAGDAEFNNVRVRGELVTAVFTYNEISATAGTFGVFKSAAKLHSDWASPSVVGNSNTMEADNDELGGMLLAVNDILWIKGFDGSGIYSCWLTVTARTDHTTYATYTVRLESGSTAKTFRAGNGIADYGPSGYGAITLSADGAVGSSPNISLVTHAGSPWSAQTLRVRIGNLNGSFGKATSVYGIGIGDYSGGNYLTYDPTASFVLTAGAGRVVIDTDGITISGSDTIAGGQLKFTDDALDIYGYISGSTAFTQINGNPGGANDHCTMTFRAYDDAGSPASFLILNAGTSGNSSRVYTLGDITLEPDGGGLIVDQGDGDSYILKLLSSDVAHGMTGVIQTDAYGALSKISAASGGLQILGLSESGYETGLLFFSISGTYDANKSTTARGVTRVYSAIKDSTTYQAVDSNGNLLTVENAGATRLIVDAEGDLHIDGSQSSYDDYDDVALVRGFEQALIQRGEIIDERFRTWLDEKRLTLQKIGILSKDPGSYFYNVTRLQRLQNGAIGQLAERLDRMERLLEGK